MNILIAARLNSEYKLKTTLRPLVEMEAVEHIYLVRRTPVDIPKTTCYCPPGILARFTLTAELYRLLTIFTLCVFKKVHLLMGIHFVLHCVYTALAGMLFRIPVMMLIIESPDKYRAHFLFNYFLRRADLIGVRGNHSREYIAETAGIDAGKIFITPDVHDFDKARPPSDTVKNYDLIFIGYYTVAKRIDILLEVMRRLRERMPHVRLALVGDGPLREMVCDTIRRFGLEDTVDRLGFVDSIYPYLHQSRVFLMTSQTEGLPTVLLEALGCGLPFIVPDVGDMRDFAVDEENALLYEPLNVEQCVAACERLLSDPALYRRLALGAREMLAVKRQQHTPDSVRRLWQERLEGVVR
ncbi:MAG: glycosyltransferase family 4 protein [Candidatus Omnitrophica bacterium]|nr:glycosyltransferase family 4 protein [Candidatus Omnitrophota bacterium]MCB9719457.1 glycosyltransferase family 4 protein [Candidatus Omnitrophota bacterium]